MNLKDYVATIKDYPTEGIMFRDITPAMLDGKAFRKICDDMVAFAKKVGAEVIIGPEARGFIFGCPVAYSLGIGLPQLENQVNFKKTVEVEYDLEYGTDRLSMHVDALKGQKV